LTSRSDPARFVSGDPTAPEAAGYLFEAGRIQEMNNNLSDAATTWNG